MPSYPDGNRVVLFNEEGALSGKSRTLFLESLRLRTARATANAKAKVTARSQSNQCFT